MEITAADTVAAHVVDERVVDIISSHAAALWVG
jgi:hypothetical protein